MWNFITKFISIKEGSCFYLYLVNRLRSFSFSQQCPAVLIKIKSLDKVFLPFRTFLNEVYLIVFSYIILASFFCTEVLIVLDSTEPRSASSGVWCTMFFIYMTYTLLALHLQVRINEETLFYKCDSKFDLFFSSFCSGMCCQWVYVGLNSVGLHLGIKLPRLNCLEAGKTDRFLEKSIQANTFSTMAVTVSIWVNGRKMQHFLHSKQPFVFWEKK